MEIYSLNGFLLKVLCTFAATASLGYDYSRQPNYGRQTVANNGVPNIGYSPENQGLQSGSVQSSPISNNHFSAPAVGPTEYKKQFYTFSAPKGEFSDNTDATQNHDLKHGLRVIFIKGPENLGLENAALHLAKSAVEQHTAIYVLNKQADIGDLANKLNALNTNIANTPEVYFVKYRTPGDAENAQHIIQSQYDGLTDKSSSHYGVAPVLSFASPAHTNNNSGDYAPAELANAYLPVS